MESVVSLPTRKLTNAHYKDQTQKTVGSSPSNKAIRQFRSAFAQPVFQGGILVWISLRPPADSTVPLRVRSLRSERHDVSISAFCGERRRQRIRHEAVEAARDQLLQFDRDPDLGTPLGPDLSNSVRRLDGTARPKPEEMAA